MFVTNKKAYEDIARKIREVPMDEPITSYEWEELVERLCASDDYGLRNIGIMERDKLDRKRVECNPDKQGNNY